MSFLKLIKGTPFWPYIVTYMRMNERERSKNKTTLEKDSRKVAGRAIFILGFLIATYYMSIFLLDQSGLIKPYQTTTHYATIVEHQSKEIEALREDTGILIKDNATLRDHLDEARLALSDVGDKFSEALEFIEKLKNDLLTSNKERERLLEMNKQLEADLKELREKIEEERLATQSMLNHQTPEAVQLALRTEVPTHDYVSPVYEEEPKEEVKVTVSEPKDAQIRLALLNFIQEVKQG